MRKRSIVAGVLLVVLTTFGFVAPADARDSGWNGTKAQRLR